MRSTGASSAMPPRQRAAVVLTELLEFSSGEAAEALGCKPATVRKLAQQGRDTLRRDARRPARKERAVSELRTTLERRRQVAPAGPRRVRPARRAPPPEGAQPARRDDRGGARDLRRGAVGPRPSRLGPTPRGAGDRPLHRGTPRRRMDGRDRRCDRPRSSPATSSSSAPRRESCTRSTSIPATSCGSVASAERDLLGRPPSRATASSSTRPTACSRPSTSRAARSGATCLPTWTRGSGGEGAPPLVAGDEVLVNAGDRLLAFDVACGTGGDLCEPSWTGIAEPVEGAALPAAPASPGGTVWTTIGANAAIFPLPCPARPLRRAEPPLHRPPQHRPRGRRRHGLRRHDRRVRLRLRRRLRDRVRRHLACARDRPDGARRRRRLRLRLGRPERRPRGRSGGTAGPQVRCASRPGPATSTARRPLA